MSHNGELGLVRKGSNGGRQQHQRPPKSKSDGARNRGRLADLGRGLGSAPGVVDGGKFDGLGTAAITAKHREAQGEPAEAHGGTGDEGDDGVLLPVPIDGIGDGTSGWRKWAEEGQAEREPGRCNPGLENR